MDFAWLARFEPQIRSMLRIIVGFDFFLVGTQKFFGMWGGLGGKSVPVFGPDGFSMLGAAGFLETFGGALILLGLFSRPVAFLLSGEMAVGYFRTHAPQGFWPITNGGERATLYCFIFLYLCAAGPGPWSLDRLLGRKTSN